MLAIVIPYYKLTYFEETLKSLENQTDKRFNVYIGNDASPENPEQLIKKYSSLINITYHVFEENLGGTALTKQWERCINLTQDEDWIMILGDDDFLENNVIEAFYENILNFEKTSNVIRYSTVVINEFTKTNSKPFKNPVNEMGLEYFIRKLKGGARNSLSEHIFNANMLKKYIFKNYENAFYVDDQLLIDFSIEKPIFSINSSVFFIRISNNSLSGSVDSKVLDYAKFQFLSYFYNKLKLFNKKDQLLILNHLEGSYNKNSIKLISSWVYLYFNYLKCFDSTQFIKLNKRLFRKIFSSNV